jgi:uncharacterized protein
VNSPVQARPPGSLPRHWFGGRVAATHLLNGVNLLFPAGERFFVRSVRHYLARIDDPAFRARIDVFFGQELQHAEAHQRVVDELVAQGFAIEPYLRAYEQLVEFAIQKAPAALALSVTVAMEHFTALMAECALSNDDVLCDVEPAMRRLLLWHAQEEFQHRSVAFDVLKLVDPSYLLRMAGLGIAMVGVTLFWLSASGVLLYQDPAVGRSSVEAELELMARTRAVGFRVFLAGLVDYARPGFHPRA